MTVVQLPEDLSLKGFFCFFFGGRWIIVIFDWFWWVVVSVATMFFFVDRVLLATSQENKGRCWRCCRVSLRKIIGITGGYRVPSNGQCNSPDRFIPLKSGSCGNKWATNLASCCFFAAFYRIMLFWSSKRRVVTSLKKASKIFTFLNSLRISPQYERLSKKTWYSVN